MIFRLPHAFLYTDPMTSRSGYGMVFVEITIFSLFPKQKGGFSRNMFILPAVIAMVFGLIYILYRSGCAVMNGKYALLYTEYPRMGKRRNCIEARFLSCSGVTKRVIRLPQSRRHQFVFSSNTTKGSVCVEIYGTQNALMATLNNEQPCLVISTEEKNGLPGCHEIQRRRWRIQADLEGVQAAERVRLAAFSTKRKVLVRHARIRDF